MHMASKNISENRRIVDVQWGIITLLLGLTLQTGFIRLRCNYYNQSSTRQAYFCWVEQNFFDEMIVNLHKLNPA